MHGRHTKRPHSKALPFGRRQSDIKMSIEEGNKKDRKPKVTPAEKMCLRLAGLCARSEQCEFDLRKKCRNAGLTAGQTAEIIRYLGENRYLDERRFARAYCNDKVRFGGWGSRKIRLGLMAKRLPADVIREALGEIDRKEYIEALKRVGLAKAKQLDMTQADERAKFFRYMASRGFETELIVKLASGFRR